MRKYVLLSTLFYAVVVLLISFVFFPNNFLKFSDAAKFADIARNINAGNGFLTNFSFFNNNIFESQTLFNSPFTPPAMPYAISLFFKVFGVSDSSVRLSSTVFFLVTTLVLNLLGTKLFNKTVGFTSSLVLLFSLNFWEYANTGASELLFILEIVLVPYLLLFKNKTLNLFSLLILILMYFTRPQAFIFIVSYLLFFLLINFESKKAFKYFAISLFVGILLDLLILLPLNGKYHLYSIFGRGEHAITQHSQYIAVSDVIRGIEKQPSSVLLTLKKSGTHLFNFYRNLPVILNPYIFLLFALSPLTLLKNKEQKYFVTTVFLAAILSFILPALTIPFYRYIHPVLPLIYLLGVASVYVVFSKLLSQNTYLKKYYFKNFDLASFFTYAFVFLFCVVISIGTLIHDYKYFDVRTNKSKAPVYANLAFILRDNTKPEDIILTNLDTWGSWYGERKTVWYPLEPKQIMNPETGEIPFDSIYLTNYLIDDENYYMGESWRQIFENPELPEMWTCEGCGRIKDEFELKGSFVVPADQTYEKSEASAVLFSKKVQ